MPLLQSRPCGLAATAAAVLCALPGPALCALAGSLRGEYGFLTQFQNITQAEARSRVRYMWARFHILEFQFYDAMEGYSHPPARDKRSWNNPFGKHVSRELIAAYVDEIEQLGGRAWLYVQAVGIDPKDTSFSQAQVVGTYQTEAGRDLLDVVVPTAGWAQSISEQWAQFAKELRFSGIHWDTLGNRIALDEFDYDFEGFLREARLILDSYGLEQTMNFVDGFGWKASLGESIAFPYIEAWTLPQVENQFFNEVAPHGGGVFVCYPGKTKQHTNEWWNKKANGISPMNLIVRRWRKAHCHGSAYLAIGDGARHIQVEYFPDTAELSQADALKLQATLFKFCHFASTLGGSVHTEPWWLCAAGVGVVFLVLARFAVLPSKGAIKGKFQQECQQELSSELS